MHCQLLLFVHLIFRLFCLMWSQTFVFLHELSHKYSNFKFKNFSTLATFIAVNTSSEQQPLRFNEGLLS